MAYPDLSISVGSTVKMDADRQIERASNGTARGRVFYTAPKRQFRVEHNALDATDQATVLGFYATNIAAEFDFVWPLDGQTYTCIFASEPDVKPLGALLATISIDLMEV